MQTQSEHGGVALADDRRRSERVACSCPANLRSPTARPDEPGVGCEAVNVSRHGALLICERPIPAGTYWRLRLDGDDRPSEREVRIMHCRENPDDGRFDVGVYFA